MNRSRNTIRNITWGFIHQVVLLVLPFIIRTIILHILGEEYLGLGSLFTSILSVLNMAELGFSSAIVFCMYKPIANNDESEICALMAYYKKIYRIIGLIILLLGLLIMPFLRHLVKGSYPPDINLYLLYSIYLFNTVVSYFLFAYKSALLNAYHRNDLLSKTSIVVTLLYYSFQIVLLYTLKNYYAYIILLPISTIVTNLINNELTKKYYPQYTCKGDLSEQTKKDISKQVKGLMISKICGTLRNSLDNIIISAFLGLVTVAIYSNYYYILNAVHGIMTIIGVSMKAGVGNSIVQESKEKNLSDFKKFSFIYSWIASWFTCCMLCLYQPFMTIWTRKQSMLFSNPIMMMFCLYFFGICMMDMRNVYMDAIGLWWEARYRSIAEGIGNLVLNIILGYYFGVVGIILATLITLVAINLIYGTKILFDNYFGKRFLCKYLLSQLKYFLITCIVGSICYFICSAFPEGIIISIVYKILLCVTLPNLLLFVFYCKDVEFSQAKKFVISKIQKRKE